MTISVSIINRIILFFIFWLGNNSKNVTEVEFINTLYVTVAYLCTSEALQLPKVMTGTFWYWTLVLVVWQMEVLLPSSALQGNCFCAHALLIKETWKFMSQQLEVLPPNIRLDLIWSRSKVQFGLEHALSFPVLIGLLWSNFFKEMIEDDIHLYGSPPSKELLWITTMATRDSTEEKRL